MTATTALRAALLIPGLLLAQNRAALTPQQALDHYGRMMQLMDATAAAVPGLVRAGAPMVENARQSVDTLRRGGNPNDMVTHYAFLANSRAYLGLADAMPKPDSFPQDARRQLNELRESVDRADGYLRSLMASRERVLANGDRDNLRRYEEANTRVGMHQAGRPRVAFLGDSITDGWRLNEYFPDQDFINRGISGQITGQMLGRMMSDVIRHRPVAMIVLAGTNDIARGVPMQGIEDNIEMIAELAATSKIRVILASVLPIHDYNKDKNPAWEVSKRRPPDSIKQLNTFIADLCKRKNYMYLDYFSALVDSAGFLKQDLADDGLHPNTAGYRVMAPLAATAIQKATSVTVLEPSNKKKRLLPIGRK